MSVRHQSTMSAVRRNALVPQRNAVSTLTTQLDALQNKLADAEDQTISVAIRTTCFTVLQI